MDKAGELAVDLENVSNDIQEGWVEWSITPTDDQPLADWSRWAGQSGPKWYARVTLPAGGKTTIDLNHVPTEVRPLAARVTLDFGDPPSVDPDGATGDDVLFTFVGR